MSYEEPETQNTGLMNNPRLLTGIILGAVGLLSIVGCVAIFFVFSPKPTPTPTPKVAIVTKIPTSTASLTPVVSATPTLNLNASGGGGGGETPTPDLTATFINRPQSRAATISEIRGSVQMKPPQGGSFTTITQNLTVPAGTTILTGEDSSAKITLTEGTIIRVGSQTQFKLDQLSGTTINPVTKLNLDFGKLWSIVGGSLGTGSYDVQTPLGVASVIGSFMSIESNPTEGSDVMACLEGKCKYSNDKGVQNLITNQQLIVKSGSNLSAPQKMDPVQVADWAPTKVTEVVTLTPTATATFTPSSTSTPTGTRTPTGTANLTATNAVQSTNNAATQTAAVVTGTASGNSVNQTATQNSINATAAMAALNLTGTASGNSLTAAANAVTANAVSTQFQLTQNVINTSIAQTAAAASLQKVSISVVPASSSFTEGNYANLTIVSTSAITATGGVTITISAVGGNSAVVTNAAPAPVPSACAAGSDMVIPSSSAPTAFTVNIPNGSTTSAVMQIPICTDTSSPESNESVTFTIIGISASTVQLGSPSSVTASIIDAVAANIGFSASTYSVAENVSGGKVTLTILASSAVPSATTINYTTVDGSGVTGANGDTSCSVSGADFVDNLAGSVIIPQGQTSVSFTIDVCYDTDNTESTETFQVQLTNAFPVNGYAAGTTTTVVSISNAAPPTVNLSQSAITVDESTGKVDVTVQLSTTFATTTFVTYTVNAGGASLHASNLLASDGTGDYMARCFGSASFISGVVTDTVTAPCSSNATSGSIGITIPPSTSSVTFSLLVADDAADEGDETFSVVLSGVSNSSSASLAIGTTSTAVVTIRNTTKPTMNISSASALESAGAITSTISISRAYKSYHMAFINPINTVTGTVASATFSTTAGTATGGGTDYTDIAASTISFLPGFTSATQAVAVNNDAIFEPDETLTVNLASLTNAGSGTTSATLTIVNDDAQPTITIAASSNPVTEPTGYGTTAVTYTVTLSSVASQNVTVNYATTAGTAAQGLDYTGTSGTLTFTPGQTSKTFTVTINGDSLNEATETFTVALSSPTIATLGTPSSITQSIADDGDTAPTVSFSPTAYEVNEGNSGSQAVQITVQFDRLSGQTIILNYATADGVSCPSSVSSATTSNNDYTPTAGSLTFAPGDQSKSFTVNVVGDTTVETHECVNLNLTLSSGTIANSGAMPLISQLVIKNDD